MGKKKTKGIKMSIAEFTQKMGYKQQENLLPTAPAIKHPTENKDKDKDAFLEKSNWRGSRVPEHRDGDNDSMQLSSADTDTNWRRKKPPLHINQPISLKNSNNRDSFSQRNDSEQRTRFGSQRNDSEQRTRFGSQRNDSEQRTRFGSQRNDSEQRTRFGSQRNDSEQRTRFGNQRNGSEQRTSFGNQRNGSEQRTSFGNQRNNERSTREYKGKYTPSNKNGFIPHWRREQIKKEEENKPKTMSEIFTNELKKEDKSRRKKKKKKKKKNEFTDSFLPMTEEEKKHVMLRIQQMDDEENKLNTDEEVDSTEESIEKEDLDEIDNFELNYIENPDSKTMYRNNRAVWKY